MTSLAALGLFAVTALFELAGCWLVWSVVRQGSNAWRLVGAVLALAAFAWLLTLHPAATGRVYAAYGGVYVVAALGWLWWIDGVAPNRFDMAGVALILAGSLVIILGNWQTGAAQ
jgi:small multidrug resistance family-3 protein